MLLAKAVGEQQGSLLQAGALSRCNCGTSLHVFCFYFFPVGLGLQLGSSGTDSQPGITLAKYVSWNIKIDFVFWLILLTEQVWSWATAQAPAAVCREVPAGFFLEEKSVAFLSAPRFHSLKHLTVAELLL